MSYPGTKSARRAYPPPVPVGFVDPGGTTPVEHALRVQQAVHDSYSNWRAAHSKDISPDVLAANKGAFRVSDAALALPPALDAVKADADAAEAKKDDLIKGTRVDTSSEAGQRAADRYWHRKERALDNIKDTSKLTGAVRDLIATTDDSEIPVLVEELPDYLASRSVPSGWLPAALSARIPGLADAQSQATLAARQHAFLAANHQNLQRAMERDTSPAPLLDPYAATAEPYGE
jgi:hypothetical protein